MKKILSLILVMMAVTLPVIAQESSSSSSTRRVGLEVTQTYGHAILEYSRNSIARY